MDAYEYRLTFDPPQILFKINDHVTQFVRKPTFDPVRTDRGESKVKFRQIHDHVIDKLIDKLSVSEQVESRHY